MSTKEIPGPFDGLERAQPGEPVFTLRAHDVLSSKLVRLWVWWRRRAIIRSEMPDERRELELIQAREAEEIADNMDDWRNGQLIVEAQKAVAYSGNEMSAAELAAKTEFDAIKGAAERIHNAIADIATAVDGLRPYNFPVHRSDLSLIEEDLKVIADSVMPRRRSYAHLAADATVTGVQLRAASG